MKSSKEKDSHWKWIDQTEPDDVSWPNILQSYRLLCKPCDSGEQSTCRNNCRSNPYCLNHLGEKAWYEPKDESEYDDIKETIEDLKKQEGGFVGLKNLGATCYANSLLQVLFHDKIFRQLLYSCDPINDLSVKGEVIPLKDEYDEILPCLSTSFSAQLQLIFALLHKSDRRYINPGFLLNETLEIPPGVQQDAHEFFKLFISKLEGCLSQQPDRDIFKSLQEHFIGRIENRIQCDTCAKNGRTSGSCVREEFRELALNINCKTLSSCLANNFEVERLEGSNQYRCNVCGGLQDASKYSRIIHLPPLLNIQLNRYTYDKTTENRKKVLTRMLFPDELDMGKYCDGIAKTRYQLKAVLCHKGRQACEGHYYADIWDEDHGNWWRFNDTEVTQESTGRKLQTADDEIEEEGGENREVVSGVNKQQAGKCKLGSGEGSVVSNGNSGSNKGEHRSQDAYMLVYERVGSDAGIKMDELQPPSAIMQYVEGDNIRLEAKCQELEEQKQLQMDSDLAQQTHMLSSYQMLVVEPDLPDLLLTLGEGSKEPCKLVEFVMTTHLKHWLSGKHNDVDGGITQHSVLCKHEKLDPIKMAQVKCVTKVGADNLFDPSSVRNRLTWEMICRECCEEQCKYQRLLPQIAEEYQEIQQLLTADSQRKKLLRTQNLFSSHYYWVGKKSLASWRRLAKEAGGVNDTNTEEVEGALEAGKCASSSVRDDGDDNMINGDISTQDKPSQLFNQEILCRHGNLTSDVRSRKLVPGRVWEILRHHFPSCPQFEERVEPCDGCQKNQHKEDEVVAGLKVKLKNLRDSLPDLFNGRNRPNIQTSKEVYMINEDFLTACKQFPRERNTDLTFSIDNSLYLCKHGLLPFLPSSLLEKDDNNDGLISISPEEREFLIYHGCSIENEIRLVVDNDSMSSFPVHCEECWHERERRLHERSFQYTREPIFIKKVLDTDTTSTNLQSTFSSSGQHIDTKKDPSYGPPEKKRKMEKLQENDLNNSMLPSSSSLSSLTQGCGVEPRRSGRTRRAKEESKLFVNSSDTLRDVKLQLMPIFRANVNEQLLFHRGQLLCELDATLSQLEIPSSATLQLVVTEYKEIEDKNSSVPQREEGFKGTGLHT